MAKKSTKTPKAASADVIPPAMDYAAHHTTYAGFISMVKWSILALGVLVVSLYFFIEGQQPLVATVLLLALPVGAVAKLAMGTRRS